jgi:hypothetical protein
LGLDDVAGIGTSSGHFPDAQYIEVSLPSHIFPFVKAHFYSFSNWLLKFSVIQHNGLSQKRSYAPTRKRTTSLPRRRPRRATIVERHATVSCRAPIQVEQPVYRHFSSLADGTWKSPIAQVSTMRRANGCRCGLPRRLRARTSIFLNTSWPINLVSATFLLFGSELGFRI